MSHLDRLRQELNLAINTYFWRGVLTGDQAEYLRMKYIPRNKEDAAD